MKNENLKQRIQGALMGAFIGDALGLGCHWYYDLDELHKDYGEWIDDYTTPKKGRYHEGLLAGDLSQSGYILELMCHSLIQNNGYNEHAFCEILEKELFPKIDGIAMHGIGGYTSQSVREVYKQRVEQGLAWSDVKSYTDNTEAIERTLAIAIFYAFKPHELATAIASNTHLMQSDNIIGSLSVAYGATLAQLVQGKKLDASLSETLMSLVQSGDLPFASPDALLTPSYMARAAIDPDVHIEPAWKVSLVYGMPCAAYHVLPASYYLAARFKDNFEDGVLHALNGGGQNEARAMLTGALIGAQVGLENIPQRFINGLTQKNYLLDLSATLAELAIKSIEY